MKLQINGTDVTVPDHLAEERLLYVLREHLGLCGTRFGCGVGICGACTVHIGGKAERSCLIPVRALAGAQVTTIEGLAATWPQPGAGTGAGETLHPVQQAWIEEAVPQCGYCQSGQIMSAAALLAATPQPSHEQICTAMAGNLCRCGTYDRIFRAIGRAADHVARGQGGTHHDSL